MNKATIKVLIAMLLWGSLGVFVKNISLDSVEIAFFRGIIGSAFLGVVLLAKMYGKKNSSNKDLDDTDANDDKKQDKKGMIVLAISGMAIGLNWVFLFNSYNYMTVANSTIVYYLAPVIVIFISPIFLKEKLTLKKVVAVICAMVGLVLIVKTQGASSANNDLFKGVMNAFLAACLYASVVILNKFIKNVDDYKKTFIQLFMASMVLVPWVILRNQINFDGAKSIILILILGIAHTGIAYCLYFSAMKDLKAQSIAILGYLDPVSSIVFSILLLKEPFSVWQLIGGAIILLAAFFAEKNPKPKEIENKEASL